MSIVWSVSLLSPALDLLIKHLPTLLTRMGWKDWALPLMPPGPRHKSLRALLHKGLALRAIRDEKEFDPILQDRIQDGLLGKLKGFEGDPADVIGR